MTCQCAEGLMKSMTAANFGIFLSENDGENNGHIFTLSHTAMYYIPSHLHATDILQQISPCNSAEECNHTSWHTQYGWKEKTLH